MEQSARLHLGGPSVRPGFGLARGEIVISPDFDDPMPDLDVSTSDLVEDGDIVW